MSSRKRRRVRGETTTFVDPVTVVGTTPLVPPGVQGSCPGMMINPDIDFNISRRGRMTRENDNNMYWTEPA